MPIKIFPSGRTSAIFVTPCINPAATSTGSKGRNTFRIFLRNLENGLIFLSSSSSLIFSSLIFSFSIFSIFWEISELIFCISCDSFCSLLLSLSSSVTSFTFVLVILESSSPIRFTLSALKSILIIFPSSAETPRASPISIKLVISTLLSFFSFIISSVL